MAKRAGLLNKVIEVHKYSVTKDIMGAQVVSYDYAFTTRARVLNLSGNRQEPNSEVFFYYAKDFVVRIYHDIDENDRIKYQGKFYRILSIDIQDDEQQQMIIHTEKIND